jgi:hypothetical protein
VTAAILESDPEIWTVGRADLRKWAEVIRAEYLEFPGLSLTAPQVQRLWSLDRDTCQCLLGVMVRQGFLKQTADAQYVRADGCRACRAGN